MGDETNLMYVNFPEGRSLEVSSLPGWERKKSDRGRELKSTGSSSHLCRAPSQSCRLRQSSYINNTE